MIARYTLSEHADITSECEPVVAADAETFRDLGGASPVVQWDWKGREPSAFLPVIPILSRPFQAPEAPGLLIGDVLIELSAVVLLQRSTAQGSGDWA